MVYEFDGTKHGKLRDIRAARRAKHRAWCAAARTSPGPPTRPARINAPGRSGATAGHAPPAATSGRSRTGAVATWTNPDGPTPDTCAWTSASPSPTCTAPAAASAQSPGPRQGAQHQREHQRLAAPVLPPREPTRPDTPRNTSTQPPWNPTRRSPNRPTTPQHQHQPTPTIPTVNKDVATTIRIRQRHPANATTQRWCRPRIPYT